MDDVDAELRALFIEEASARLERLVKALEGALLEAHTVKGSAAVAGLPAYSAEAATIESMLAAPLDAARLLLAQLRPAGSG